MPYLALAVTDETELGHAAGRITISPRIGAAVQRDLGSTVLLYRRTGDLALEYFAQARLAGLYAPADGGRQCQLESIAWFPTPVRDTGEGASPSAQRLLSLGLEQFEQVLRQGRAELLRLPGSQEAASLGFTRSAPNNFYHLVQQEVLRRWDHRCAVTELQFAQAEGIHPQLRMVPIRPLEAGGPREPRNFLPMVELAERAWLTGAIGVAADGNFIAVLNRLDPDLLEAMPPDGKLLLPARSDQQPDPDLLAWHRTNVFGRG